MNRRYVVLGFSIVLALSLAVPALGGPGSPVATVAGSAKAKAQKALNKAKQAQATADSALATGNQALSTANAANTKATTAQTAANAAQASATAANNNANTRLLDTTTVTGTASANDATDQKIATANCPGDDKVTGGGFAFGGTDYNDETVVLESTYGDQWYVAAEEIDNTSPGNWSIQANAVCANN
jgi:hypothetical protein